jgi:ribosomal protein S18 acetylase RimI-like enzyme
MTFRTWGGDDVAFLWEMLYESLHVKDGAEPFPRSVLADPGIAHYLADFGATTGDDAQICVGATGSRVGAAWCRRLSLVDPGCGYVDDDTPELGMAVVAEWRGKGIGRRLLEDLLARNPSMSLSVDDENEGATALYRSIGFVPVGVVEQSTTMVRRLGLRRP